MGAGTRGIMRRFGERRNARRLWTAVGSGLMPPPPRSYQHFGSRSMVIPPARVQAPECIRIGDRVRVHEHSWLCVVPQPGLPAPLLEIGDGTSINRFVKIVCAARVTIGDECLIGDHVFIADTHYRFDDPTRPIGEQPLADPLPVTIARGCHIGYRAIIQPGVTLGENAYVGAGAVVTQDVPARTVVVGHPARVVRRFDEATGSWVSEESGRRTRKGGT